MSKVKIVSLALLAYVAIVLIAGLIFGAIAPKTNALAVSFVLTATIILGMMSINYNPVFRIGLVIAAVFAVQIIFGALLGVLVDKEIVSIEGFKISLVIFVTAYLALGGWYISREALRKYS